MRSVLQPHAGADALNIGAVMSELHGLSCQMQKLPQLAPQPALSLPILIAEVEAEIGAFELSASASVAREHLLASGGGTELVSASQDGKLIIWNG